jgi:hypothetical protein
MNKVILNTIVLSLFLIVRTLGFGQLTTVNLSIEKDSYTDTKYPGNPYGSSTTMKASTHSGLFRGTFAYGRSYVECDLSSIPYNATILSASIKLKSSAAAVIGIGSMTWKTKLVTGSWVESTMTHNNGQPTISGLAADITTTTPSGTVNESLDVTSMVQRMVLGTTTNYGWCIQVSNEGYQGITGATFYTSDHGTSSFQPYLEVQYYVPLSIATANITHESGAGLSDGGVAFTVTGGASTQFDYYWTNAAGTSISTTLASSSPVALQNQPYGWYGLRMVGTNYGEELYHAFIVGTDCEEVTITFQPNGNFTDDALLYDRTGYKDLNYGGYILLRAENYYSTFRMRNMLGFKLWMDDAFTVNQADMTLYGWNHNNIAGTNEAQFKMATSDWEQSLVTHNTMPTVGYPYASLLAVTTTSNQNDIVDLTAFWNDWKQDNTTNYGMLYQLMANNSTHRKRRGYYSPSYSINQPSIEFKLDLRKTNFLTSSWDSDTELGTATVDISDLCVTQSPYFYYLSADTIIDLDSLYGFFTDTIIGMDSTTFYGTSTTDLQKTYTHLEPGSYHFTVFDKFGVRLVDESLHIMDNLGFDAQTGLTISGNEVTASIANSVGSFDLYTHEDIHSEMKIDIMGLSGDQFFGLSDITKTVASYADIEYGFHLSNTKLYTVNKGNLSSYFIVATVDTELEVINENGTLRLLVDGIEKESRIMGTEFSYKFGMGGQPSNKIGFYPAQFVWFKKKFRFWSDATNHFKCDGTGGLIYFSVDKTLGAPGCTVDYSVTGPGGTQNGLSTSTQTSTPISTLNGNPLVPGMYTVTGTIASCGGTAVPFTQSFYLGYEVDWNVNSIVNYTTPTSNSVLRTSAFDGTFSKAIAKNIDVTGEGWVEFTPKTRSLLAQWFPTSFFRLEFSNFGAEYPAIGEGYMMFKEIGANDVWFVADFGQGPYSFFIKKNDRILVKYSNSLGTIELRKNGNFLASYTMNPLTSIVGIKCQSKNSSYGYENVIASFSCSPEQPEETIDHAELKKTVNGGFALAVEGQLKFTFDEKYNGTPQFLPFNIYSKERTIIASCDALGNFSGISAAIPYQLTDGRYTIDLGTISQANVGEFYVLEVFTQKGDKRYLKLLYKN